jgi:hypothetical protein
MSNSALVDIKNEDGVGNLDKLRKDLAEAVATPEKDPEPEKPENKEPEKYRGKSREDIMEMHMNAERKIGMTGNELGQYKQLTDQLLDLKRREDLAKGGAEAEEEDEPLPKITSTEILDDPDSAIGRAVEARLNRAEKKKAKQTEQEQLTALQTQFVQRHPDYQEIASDPEFESFVKESQSRQMLAAAALQAGNLYAANALLDEYKSRHSSQEATEESKKDDNIEAARKASTVSTGSSSASDAPTGKVYSRLDLIRLKLEDPETYGSEAFQNEILRAYAEGRVK